jgi:NTE family protein
MRQLAFVLFLSGCSTLQPARNPPALPLSADQYRAQNMARGPNSDTLLLSLTFSGGGMRSAAASYYLLDEFRKQQVRVDGVDKPLLHEVDFISSISGGSIAAAYYALYRERMFTDFVPEVLRRDMQGEMLSGLFNPRSLHKLGGDHYGRGDYLADYLDQAVFRGKSYGDVPRVRPFVRVGATDMLKGARVEFTQEGFDTLCSDLDPVPVARAVAASSAVPGIFSPINIADYSSDCALAGYADPRYRHLIDGGIADNLGVSGPLQAVGRYKSLVDAMRAIGFRGIRNYAIVVLNVQNNTIDPRDGSPRIPSLWRTINASVDGNLHADSAETTAKLRNTVAQWQQQIANDPSAVDDNIFASARPKVFLIEIDFAKIAHPEMRRRLQSIPTELRLNEENEQLLADFVREALRLSPEYQALLKVLEADERARAAAQLPANDAAGHETTVDAKR